ncbi:MAG TPA: DUF2207 domain-containing protein [Acidimicrobiales bacterium]|nr:DUF2207 domain-containing protein [Acidimicrobiales bacterium]
MVTFLAVAPPAEAQPLPERIERYEVTIDIRRDGSYEVIETIAYDFGPFERHGIFRTIPVRFPYDPDPKFERIYELTGIRVDGSEGTPDDVEETDENGRKLLRVGDADKTISGAHTYRIRYVVRGGLNAFADHDELHWNAIGDEWDVPIGSAAVTVRAPDGVNRVACFAGPRGSGLPCAGAEVVSSTEATFRHGPIGNRQALTVVVAMVKGTIDAEGTKPILDEKFSLARAYSVTPGTTAGALAAAVLAFGYVARLLWRTGRDRKIDGTSPDDRRGLGEDDESPVVFRPPGDARPAQVGVLVDERADALDVTATIVDLAVRGYLEIRELPKEGWFGKTDWNLVEAKPADDDLLPFERRLVKGLFEGRSEVTLSSLKNTFASDLKAVQTKLYGDCVQQGWFAKRPDQVRNIYLTIGVVGVLLAAGALALLTVFTHAALIGIPVLLAALVLAIGHRWTPARTAKGSAALREARGFRRFIETAEADRMQFAEEENIFAKYLPYAIVFGETEKWAKAFAGLGGAEAPAGMGWYHPYGSWSAFNASSFSNSMDSFAVHTSGTIASTPASSGSSGFSGGSSGGGGGGGGGGSW